MLLAVAARTFNEPSQTFVRDHVRVLAPGATVLMCQDDGAGTERLGCPVLTKLDAAPARFRRAVGEIARRLGVRGLPQPLRLSRADRRRAVDFLRAHRPRALLAEFGPCGVQFADAANEAGVPLFVHFHGFDATILPKSPRIRLAYRKLFRQAEGIIATSGFLKARLLDLGCPSEKLHVSPCGIDAGVFAPQPGRAPGKSILMVSRLIPQKGPLFTLASFALVCERHSDATLEVIGDGPLRNAAEAEARRIGIDGRVVFHGSRPHSFVAERLRSAALLAQHCVTIPRGGIEALGLSVLEAMACEVPVVATRHGGMMETVEHGATGMLVPERDVEGMAAAICQLLDEPVRAAEMGAAARARVLEHFTQAKARDRLRAIMGLPAAEQAASW